jgi:hypothetical protein
MAADFNAGITIISLRLGAASITSSGVEIDLAGAL